MILLKRRCLIKAVFIIVALLLPVISIAQEKSEDLEALKAAEKQERLILKELEDIEIQVGRLEDRQVEIEQGVKKINNNLSKGDRELAELNKKIKSRKKYIAARLRAIYKLRDGGVMQVLLEADSLRDLLYRYRYLTLILKRDEHLLSEYDQLITEYEERQAQLKEDHSKLYELKVDLANEAEKLSRKRLRKTALLMEVHQRKELYLKVLNSREESRQRLIKEVIIKPRERAAQNLSNESDGEPDKKDERKWPDFAAMKGEIPRPAAGKVTGRFGRRPGPFDTVLTSHGLVFSVPDGSPVKAVLSGEVLYVGWLKGYGNIIILNHGSRYYTLTGGIAGQLHKAGQWVSQGTVLGYAPKGGQSKKKDIYFEIRHKGQALNPSGWLGRKPVS